MLLGGSVSKLEIEWKQEIERSSQAQSLFFNAKQE